MYSIHNIVECLSVKQLSCISSCIVFVCVRGLLYSHIDSAGGASCNSAHLGDISAIPKPMYKARNNYNINILSIFIIIDLPASK